MEIATHLNDTLTAAGSTKKLDYDENIKELLADVQIMSRILKYTVKEVQHLSIEEIAECLQGIKIEVGQTPLDPGLTNTGKILQENTQDIVQNEGTIYFDVRFTFTNIEQNIRVVVNVEAQRKTGDSDLKYHIESRMVYYLSRLISAQKNTEFFKDDYDNIKTVYSIWICTDAKESDDSICEYSLAPKTIYGNTKPSSYADKMKGVIIRIRKDAEVEESKNKLIMMLEDLLKYNTIEQKKEELVRKHGMKMTVSLERRLETMCNLSENLIEKGEERGREAGLREGKDDERRRIIQAKLEKKYTYEEIAEAIELPLEQVKEIAEQSKTKNA